MDDASAADVRASAAGVRAAADLGQVGLRLGVRQSAGTAEDAVVDDLEAAAATVLDLGPARRRGCRIGIDEHSHAVAGGTHAQLDLGLGAETGPVGLVLDLAEVEAGA